MCGVAEALMVAGSLVQYRQHRATAKLYDRQADIAHQRGLVDQERIRRKYRQEQSRQRVRYGTSGIQISGSPLEVQASIKSEGEYEARLAGWDADRRADSFRQNAFTSRYEGSNLLTGTALKVGDSLYQELKKP